MDIHPLLIHFPIALLTLYSLFELASIKRLQEKPYWFHVKAVFVILGALGATATFISGMFAEHFVRGEPLVEAHLEFILATSILSSVIAILYALVWFGSARTVMWAGKLLFSRVFMVPVALAILLAVTIAGGLGGAIVYGTRFDPLMAPVFKLLNLY